MRRQFLCRARPRFKEFSISFKNFFIRGRVFKVVTIAHFENFSPEFDTGREVALLKSYRCVFQAVYNKFIYLAGEEFYSFVNANVPKYTARIKSAISKFCSKSADDLTINNVAIAESEAEYSFREVVVVEYNSVKKQVICLVVAVIASPCFVECDNQALVPVVIYRGIAKLQNGSFKKRARHASKNCRICVRNVSQKFDTGKSFGRNLIVKQTASFLKQSGKIVFFRGRNLARSVGELLFRFFQLLVRTPDLLERCVGLSLCDNATPDSNYHCHTSEKRRAEIGERLSCLVRFPAAGHVVKLEHYYKQCSQEKRRYNKCQDERTRITFSLVALLQSPVVIHVPPQVLASCGVWMATSLPTSGQQGFSPC